jgi:hypothetical protein
MRLICPECVEKVVKKTPRDLTPWQRHRGDRPRYSHRDGTQLCPVMGRHGYQPATPHRVR